MKLENLEKAIRESWDASTGYSIELFNSEKPSAEQCRTTSLIVQDYLGGDILLASYQDAKNEGTYYWNILENGQTIDLTFGQFYLPVNFSNVRIVTREETLDDRMKETYPILKQRVETLLESL